MTKYPTAMAFDLPKILVERSDEILARFVSETRRTDVTPKGLSRSLLVDHIPGFLAEMSAELAQGRTVRISEELTATSATAREHGEQRWTLGYDLEGLIREYAILRECILQVVRAAGVVPTFDEMSAFMKCMSVGVEQAATEYVKHRDGELDAERAELTFLADAGQLLSSTLDYRSTLRRLVELLVPRMADWCSVRLDGESADDMMLSHVDREKIATLREIYRRDPMARSPRGSAHAVASSEPVLVREVEPDFFDQVASNDEARALMRVIDTKSWIVVPLAVQAKAFGALTLGYSESGRRYGERELVLASDLARRASVAIDNARLYDSSQNERSRAEAVVRARDEFVAMVSHELRTPLNAMLGWLHLMRVRALSAEKREHAFEVIERNALAQSRLVDDLLDISRALQGTIRITPSQVDLSGVVELAIEGMRPAADAKRIQIDVALDREHALMRGDAHRLQQVAWNLLTNAVKFTPKGGHVKVALRRVESDLELIVEDDGAGIPTAFLPFVFERFRQLENSATRSQGLGIGLAIAKQIVDLHGGTITAASDGVGHGAVFTVRLPVSALVSTTVGVTRVPATQASLPNDVLPTVSEGISVLVVDDEPDARELLSYVFEASGIQVRTTASVGEALAELEAFRPNVIVSDIGLPEEDGYAFIRRLRTLPDDRKSIPAIALTAFSRNEDRKRALVDGFNAHMVKPVEPAKLVEAVRELARAYVKP